MKPAMIGGVLVAMAALLSATSLAASASDYVQAGGPPANQAWTVADYEKFNELASSGRIELPMLGSDETRPIFLALVNRNALARYSDKLTSLDDRAHWCGRTYNALSLVMMKYAEQHNSGKADCSREMARVTAFMLHTATVMVNLTREMPPANANDEFGQRRMRLLASMKESYRILWRNAAAALSQRNVRAEEETLLMAEAMIEELPAQSEFIGPASVQEIGAKTAALVEKEGNDKVKLALRRLLMTCNSLAAQ
jgi:hypothetical protein